MKAILVILSLILLTIVIIGINAELLNGTVGFAIAFGGIALTIIWIVFGTVSVEAEDN